MSNPKLDEDVLGHTEIVLMKGLPYSGKSYELGQYLAKQGSVFDAVVSPDCIRVAMHGERFLPRAEGMVWATAKIMARSLALWGHDRIFIDATGTKYEGRRIWSLHDPWNVTVWEIKTPHDICIQRAIDAEDSVMLPIIERMHMHMDGLKEFEVPFDAT